MRSSEQDARGAGCISSLAGVTIDKGISSYGTDDRNDVAGVYDETLLEDRFGDEDQVLSRAESRFAKGRTNEIVNHNPDARIETIDGQILRVNSDGEIILVDSDE